MVSVPGSWFLAPVAWDGLTIAVSVSVTAEPSAVWEVLTRFDAYPEWSRAISRIEGKPAPGSRLHAWLAQGTPFAREMEGQIVDVDQPLRLVWEGGVPGVFFDRHSFEIATNQPAGTCVTSSESFSRFRSGDCHHFSVSGKLCWFAPSSACEQALSMATTGGASDRRAGRAV